MAITPREHKTFKSRLNYIETGLREKSGIQRILIQSAVIAARSAVQSAVVFGFLGQK
jgi:hypothetical protein